MANLQIPKENKLASLNKFQCIGNLGRDPELRSFPSGDQLATVSIGVTEKWKDKTTGEAKEHTEWVRVVFNGRLAEIVGQYLHKGSQVYVEGSLRTRKWTDKDGVEKYSTEIRADLMQMLAAKRTDGERPSAAQRPRPAPVAFATPVSSGFDDMSDDIPF